MQKKRQQGEYPVAQSSAAEFRRLSLQDELLNNTLPLLPASISIQPKRVLDVACGTGGWLRRFAQAYPQATCMGLDKNDLLLGYARDLAVDLQNVEYVQGDMFDIAKIFRGQQFDFIQMRFATWFVGVRKQEVFGVIKDLLAPGGTFCLIDYEQPFSTTSFVWKRYSQLFFEALKGRGVIYAGASEFPPLFKSLGFANVQLIAHVLDLSAATPGIQEVVNDMRSAIQTVGHMIVVEGLLSEDEFEELKQQCFTEMEADGFGMLAYFLTITGQKA